MRLSVLGVIAAASMASAADAQSEAPSGERHRASFESATGRNLLNYPPHRTADFTHMRLEVTIDDMDVRRLTGICTLAITPIAGALSELRLDAGPPEHMRIESVRIGGAGKSGARFTHEGETLTIALEPAVQQGQQAEVVVSYTVTDPPDGIIWTPASAAWPGLAAQLHSQGETESNRYWFPCHDFPNERMSTELIATVPYGYTVVSNGALVSHREEFVGPSASPRRVERFHWSQARGHVSYLVSMVVGKFEEVDVGPVGQRRVPAPVFVPPADRENVARSFGRTGKMVTLFERLFDEPYPWDKYAQVVVRNFGWGGMENTSATTLVETTPMDERALADGTPDDLTSHELAHQWFGDLITCKLWEHAWLNEGWATYAEALWDQYAATAGSERLKSDDDAYQWVVIRYMRQVLVADKADAPFQPAMVSKEYAHPEETFDRKADAYAKGGSILHMLREKMGDKVFFRAVAEYVDRCKDRSVETYEFRRALEDVSGLSLQRFFDQWCLRPGVPEVEVGVEWSSSESKLTVSAKQTQNIDGANPAYAFTLPVWVRCEGEREYRVLDVVMDGKAATASVTLPGEPVIVAVDPNLTVLADLDVSQPASRWVAQLREGPTLAARLQAAEHLGDAGGAASVNSLGAMVGDARAFYAVRQGAIEALGELANPTDEDDEEGDRPGEAAAKSDAEAMSALLALADKRLDDARVRKALHEQLAHAAKAAPEPIRVRVVGLLSTAASGESSYAARAAALVGLGKLKAVDQRAVIEAGLQTASQGDKVRQAALEAVGAMGEAWGLDLIVPFAHEGTIPATRAVAAGALAALSKHDPARVANEIESMLRSHEPRTAEAAATALAEIGSERTLAILDSAAATTKSRLWKHTLTTKAAEAREVAGKKKVAAGVTP